MSAISLKNPTVLPTPPPSSRADYWKRLSEAELVQQCRQGEPAAYETLLLRYERFIYSQAYRLTGNYNDASDITAQAFLRIYASFGTFRHDSPLSAWIYRIVRNLYADSCRRNYRLPLLSLANLLENADTPLMTITGQHTLSPHACAEVAERNAILKNAISALPVFLCRTMTLYYGEDRSYQEIAGILGVPLGTIKSRLFRGRLALQEMLASEQAVFID